MVGSGTGKMNGYPLVDSLVVEVRYYKVASNGRLDGNEGVKIDIYPLRELLFAYGGSEIVFSSGMSYGNIYGKLEVYPLG